MYDLKQNAFSFDDITVDSLLVHAKITLAGASTVVGEAGRDSAVSFPQEMKITQISLHISFNRRRLCRAEYFSSRWA